MNFSLKLLVLACWCVLISSSVHAQCASNLLSYVTSDQKDDYFSGTNLTLTLNVDLPAGATGVTYSCTWTAVSGSGGTFATPPSSSSPTASISSAGVYRVSGTVNYNSCSSVTFNDAEITIRDAFGSSGLTYSPKHYWTFEPAGDITVNNATVTIPAYSNNSNDFCEPGAFIQDYQMDIATMNSCADPAKKNTKHKLKLYNSYNGNYTTTSGLVGDAADLDHLVSADLLIPNTQQISQEFLVKFDASYGSALYYSNYSNTDFKYGFPLLRITSSSIMFGVSFLRGSSTTPESRTKTIALTGTDRSDWNYYLDNDWHHIAVTCDLERGQVRLFVDGSSPDGFTLNYFPDPANDKVDLHATNNYWHSIGTLGSDFGELDEYAFYDQALSPTIVAKHYRRAMNHNEHYSYTDDVKYSQVPGTYLLSYLESDQKDDYLCNSGSVTVTLNVELPDGATSPVYSCKWNGSSTMTSSTTHTVTSAQNVTVEGTVTYTLGGATETRFFNEAFIQIQNGNSASGGTFAPSHYWTFEPAGNITVNGASVTIPASNSNTPNCGSSNPIIDFQTDIATMNSCATSGQTNTQHNMELYNSNNEGYDRVSGVVGNAADLDHLIETRLFIPHTQQISQEFLIRFDPRYYSSQFFSDFGNTHFDFGFPILKMSMGKIEYGVSFIRGVQLTWKPEQRL
ncbi:hypothetical protein KFE98_02835 [bacterium SCSIO 12741]|nr:hypothetical protein KFE98_02835 [bacterium SCSIO 12741]